MTNVSLSPGERAAYANGLEDGQKLQKRPAAWRVGPLKRLGEGEEWYAIYATEAPATVHQAQEYANGNEKSRLQGLYLRDENDR